MKTMKVWSAVAALAIILSMAAAWSNADVIIDNGSAGTSSTGTWQVSGAAGPYGVNSLWSYNGATYTWSFTPTDSGVYRVSMWWTALSSRYASVPVAIVYAGGTANLTVDQRTNGGQWNSLGEYLFSAGTPYSVRLAATPSMSPPSTCADAVKFELISAAPTAVIDSITPNPAEPGVPVQFTGHGSPGTITAWEWSSNINGVLSTAASSTTTSLSNGTHTISFRVQNDQGIWSAPVTQSLTVGPIPTEFIIDNGQQGTSSTGSWAASGAAGFYGTNSLWSYNGATYTWSFTPVKSGTYDVSMWWTALSSRYQSVPVAITYSGGTANRTVDQRTNGGQWNSLGEYQFDGGTTYNVRLTATPPMSPPSTCADAVKVTLMSSNAPPIAVIDSIEPNVADVNEPITFTGHGEDTDGTIAAYLWKIDDVDESNEPSFVTGEIPEGLHTVSFIVQDDAGEWSAPAISPLKVGNAAPEAFIDSISPNPAKLGTTIVFTGHGQDSDGTITGYKWETNAHGEISNQNSFSITASSLGEGTYTVKFSTRDNKGAWSEPATQSLIVGNVKPTAVIDSIVPPVVNLGENITFTGHGIDVDGSIVGYSWDSDISGHLSDQPSFSTTALPLGDHIISFTVTDNNGAVSEPNKQEVVVNEVPTEVIVDNGQPGTSFTGTWQVSGSPYPCGTNALWSYNGATYTWAFTPTSTSVYRVSMCWTSQNATRSASVPVSILHAAGTTNLTVNQQLNGNNQNGINWNNIGEYTMNAGTAYSVRIIAPSGSPPSTCADAVKFEKIAMPSTPIANFTATPITGGAPLAVQFSNTSLGIINSRLWNFGDGTTSAEINPTHTYANVGKYTVSLTVTNAAGSDVETKTDYIETVSDHENIYVCGIYSWNNGLTIYTESMLQDIGATRISTDHWRYAARGRTYFINMVRTKEGMEAALKEEGAHVVTAGHSNFGFGSAFATSQEFRDQEILDILYVDDDRFVQFSSDMVSVKPDGMKYGQAYPNWTLTRKDGTSAAMPYTFAEAKAKGKLPPYNYYETYQRPGDPNVYKTELASGKLLERFPDSGVPAWYSPTGAPPDPCLNPEYFIINDDPDYNRFESVGTWPFAKVLGGGFMGTAGYIGYNYQYHQPGNGSNKAIWTSYIRTGGLYAVMASWFPSPLNATNARYTINSPAGPVVVDVNQRTSAPLINVLGVVYLTPGSWTVELTDAANGLVVADCVALNPLGNPANIVSSEFKANVQTGAAPLEVQFTSLAASSSIMGGSIQTYHWDFGDGTFSNLKDASHTYTAPGKYTVSLTVSTDPNDPNASVVGTKTNFITVGQTPELRAQFSAPSRYGPDKTNVYFIDQSTGNITGWLWNFGDGKTSTERAPMHVYTVPGPYTVSLTVTGPDGSSTETKPRFVYDLIGLIVTDNTFVDKPHYYSRSGAIVFGKVICDTSGTKIPNADMKYARLFMGSCNSANYFTGAFNHGIYFCTTADIYEYTAKDYLKDYLYRGWSDATILQHMNEINPGHDYVNFNLKPPSVR